MVPTSPAELIDKLTILRLKVENLTDKQRQTAARHQNGTLQDIANQFLPQNDTLCVLWDLLYEINKDLWTVQNDLRAYDARGEFGLGFIALARASYTALDKRAAVKREINMTLGANMFDERSFG